MGVGVGGWRQKIVLNAQSTMTVISGRKGGRSVCVCVCGGGGGGGGRTER